VSVGCGHSDIGPDNQSTITLSANPNMSLIWCCLAGVAPSDMHGFLFDERHDFSSEPRGIGCRINCGADYYLDLCCVNRPFDDQHQARVRLEVEAVLALECGDFEGNGRLAGARTRQGA